MIGDSFDDKKFFTSDFNEAKFQIMRLHNSWELCKSYARSGKLIDWNWEMDNIYAELTTDAENADERIKDNKTYDNKIGKLNELVANNKNSREKLYQILRLKEKILKRLQDVAGKGSKRSSEDEDDIES